MTAESDTVLKTSPPIADAGDGGCLTSDNEGLLDASKSHLMSGKTKFNFNWEQIYGPTAKIKRTNKQKTSFIPPKVDMPGIIGFKLTTSNENGSTFDEVYYVICPKGEMN
jgi:hypothetical protein